VPHAVFHVVLAWKYGDVLVIILNRNTAVITAVVLETRLSLETVAENQKTENASRKYFTVMAVKIIFTVK
jgi:hypothetical protein